jgi:hypothetical protein
MEIITLLLEDAAPSFQNLSFFHSPVGQDIWHQLVQGDLGEQISSLVKLTRSSDFGIKKLGSKI